MDDSVSFAILAPIPDEHLVSGVPVVDDHGYVAYGSNKWELFVEIDKLRGDQKVPVLIYPSDEDGTGKMDYVIKWTGMYCGHEHSEGGTHPEGMKHRPESTMQYAGDISGFWAIFWHVAELKKLNEADYQPISSLLSYKSGKYWKAGHPPRGPEIVARPKWL